MSKVNKILLTIIVLLALFIGGFFLFVQNSGNTLSKEFQKSTSIEDLDNEYKTYEIGTPIVGYLHPSVQFELLENNGNHVVYKHNDEYIIMDNLNEPPALYNSILAGDKDAYTDNKIKELPNELNECSRRVLNNLYNKGYLTEKLMLSEARSVLITGMNKEGTPGDYYKKALNTNPEYSITYCITSNNILIMVIQPDEFIVDTLDLYSKESKNN